MIFFCYVFNREIAIVSSLNFPFVVDFRIISTLNACFNVVNYFVAIESNNYGVCLNDWISVTKIRPTRNYSSTYVYIFVHTLNKKKIFKKKVD